MEERQKSGYFTQRCIYISNHIKHRQCTYVRNHTRNKQSQHGMATQHDDLMVANPDFMVTPYTVIYFNHLVLKKPCI